MKSRSILSAALFSFCFTSMSAMAHEYQLATIKIGHPWARATVSAQKTAGAYMKIENAGVADKLLSVSSPAAQTTEVHSMKMEGDVMTMQKIEGLDLPSNQMIELKPGGYHIMFFNLKTPLKEGEKFPLKLKFEHAGEITVDVKVESVSFAVSGADHSGHMGNMH